MATVILKLETFTRSKQTGSVVITGVETGVEEPEARALIIETTQPDRLLGKIASRSGGMTDPNATATILHCGKLYTYQITAHWVTQRWLKGKPIKHSFRAISIAIKSC